MFLNANRPKQSGPIGTPNCHKKNLGNKKAYYVQGDNYMYRESLVVDLSLDDVFVLSNMCKWAFATNRWQ